MKIVSIKRLVLAFTLGLGGVMTLPAYAWPDTDEMNMCGAAIKTLRTYNGDRRSWSARDIYIKQLGDQYYYRANCPESKATKNYKGKYWTPAAKMQKKRRKPMHKHRMKNKHHNKQAAQRSKHKKYADHDFYRAAQAVLNMGKTQKAKKGNTVYNPKHKNHADCVRTDGLNNSGAVLRVVRKR